MVFAQEKTVEEVFSNSTYSFKDGGLQLYRSQDKDKRLTLGGKIITRYAIGIGSKPLQITMNTVMGFKEPA